MIGPEEVSLKEAPSATELQLQVEVQAAYEEQLAFVGQSSRRLLERVAVLCDRSECTGPAIATALRELAKVEGRLDMDLQTSTPKNDRQAGGTGSSTPKEKKLISCIPQDIPNQEAAAMLREISPAPKEQELALLPLTGAAHHSFDAEKTFEDFDDEHMKQMRHAFEIPQCAWIEPSGRVKRPPSDFEAIFGPRLRRFYEGLTQPWCQPMNLSSCFVQFVQSGPFKTVGALVIMLNFLFIIVQSDYRLWAEINYHGKKEADWMKTTELGFTLYYCFELMCLMVAYRKDFFLGADMSWNWFDFIIVLTGVMELLLTAVGGAMLNLSFLRVLRFFKMSRVLRMFSAMRMVKDVKVMVDALTGSFVIFLFGSMLLAMFLSVFSIFFVQGFATFLEAEAPVTGPNSALRQAITDDFGSVATAMRSLYMSATGGDDWSKYHMTIKVMGAPYDYLYLFFIAFTLIAFFNVITGVFAEKAMSLAMPTMEELTSRRLGREVRDSEELAGLLNRVLKTSTPGVITIDAFEEMMSHPEVVAFFEVRALKSTTAHRFLVQMMEINQTDKISVGAFVSACIKLDGSASSIDLHVLSVEVKTVLMKQHMLQDFLNDRLRNISALVQQQIADGSSVTSVARPVVAVADPSSGLAQEGLKLASADSKPSSVSPSAASIAGSEGNRDVFPDDGDKLNSLLPPPTSIAYSCTRFNQSDSQRTNFSPNANQGPHSWKPSRPAGDDSDDRPLSPGGKSAGFDVEESGSTMASTIVGADSGDVCGVSEL